MKAINRDILALAVPSIIANITTPLLGLVDTAITGHLDNDMYLAAIALGSSMFNLLYWLFGFLRMGTGGLTAIATGRGDKAMQSLLLWRGLVISFAIAALMIAMSPLLVDGLLDFLGADEATNELARRYFSIVIWGAPAVLATYVLTGWFLGQQSSHKPMVISITINVINITVSPILTFGLGMKLEGVATGTLVAQWAGLITGLMMCRSYHPERVSLRGIFELSTLGHYFRINSDIMMRTACLIAVTLWFTRAGARQGDTILSVNALLMQFFILFSYMTDGFAYAGEALIGRFTGARDTSARRECIKALMRWGTALAVLYSIIYFFAGESILSVLTDSHHLLEAARDYMPWAVTIPLAGFLAFIWDGIYIGCTATRLQLVAMFVAMVVFFALYYALREPLGNHGLWLAFTGYLLTRGLMQTLLWRRITAKEQ